MWWQHAWWAHRLNKKASEAKEGWARLRMVVWGSVKSWGGSRPFVGWESIVKLLLFLRVSLDAGGGFLNSLVVGSSRRHSRTFSITFVGDWLFELLISVSVASAVL